VYNMYVSIKKVYKYVLLIPYLKFIPQALQVLFHTTKQGLDSRKCVSGL
jgi:hypothetical protein